MRAAMKTKQTADMAAVQALRAAVDRMARHWTSHDDHGHGHGHSHSRPATRRR